MIGLAGAGECDPGAVHRLGETDGLRGFRALEHRRIGPVREIVEHERNLQAVAGFEPGRRLPVELKQIGRAPLIRPPFGHPQGADPKHRVRHQVTEQRRVGARRAHAADLVVMLLVSGLEHGGKHPLDRSLWRVLNLLVDAVERRHLLARRSEHHVDVGAGSGLERGGNLRREDVAVDHRPERCHGVGEFLLEPRELALRRHEFCGRQRLEHVGLLWLEAQHLEQPPSNPMGVVERARHAPERRALQDRAAEQSACRRHGHQHRNRRRARRLSDHGHVRRIAAKGRDIVAHEAQGGDLIEQAEIATAHAGQAQEPQRAKPVVDRNRDHVAVRGEPLARIPGQRAGAAAERAAVDPHQHRTLAGMDRRRPDREREAILGLRAFKVAHDMSEPRARLRRDRAVAARVAHALPRGRRLRG